VLARSDDRQVGDFARGMIMTQESDIDAMEQMLEARA